MKYVLAFLLFATASSEATFNLAVIIPESELLVRLSGCETYAAVFAQDAYAAGYFAGQASVYLEYLDVINRMRPGDK